MYNTNSPHKPRFTKCDEHVAWFLFYILLDCMVQVDTETDVNVGLHEQKNSNLAANTSRFYNVQRACCLVVYVCVCVCEKHKVTLYTSDHWH